MCLILCQNSDWIHRISRSEMKLNWDHHRKVPWQFGQRRIIRQRTNRNEEEKSRIEILHPPRNIFGKSFTGRTCCRSDTNVIFYNYSSVQLLLWFRLILLQSYKLFPQPSLLSNFRDSFSRFYFRKYLLYIFITFFSIIYVTYKYQALYWLYCINVRKFKTPTQNRIENRFRLPKYESLEIKY